MSRNFFLNSRGKGKVLNVNAWHGYQVIILEWILIFITFLMVAVRCFVQIWYRNKPLRELFVVIAWVFFLVNTICDSIMNSYNWMNLDGNAFQSLTREQRIYVLKLNYLESFMYKPSMYLCKAALLCFYVELCSKEFYPKTFRLIQMAWFFVVAGLMVQILYDFLECVPFSLNWRPNPPSCSYSRPYFATTWSFHVFSDLLVYIIPFFIICQLQNLNRTQKAGATAMFATGFVNLLCAATILVLSLITYQSAATLGAYNFLYTIQIGSAIIVVCVPQMKLLVTRKYSHSVRKRANSQSRYGEGSRNRELDKIRELSFYRTRNTNHERTVNLDRSTTRTVELTDGVTVDFDAPSSSPIQMHIMQMPFEEGGRLEARVTSEQDNGDSGKRGIKVENANKGSS